MDMLTSLLVLVASVVIPIMLLEFIFRKTRRVAATILENQDAILAKAKRSIENITGQTDDRLDDELYAQALTEVDSGHKDLPIWGRAIVDSDGDEVKAKALYIKYRVKRLKSDHSIDKMA